MPSPDETMRHSLFWALWVNLPAGLAASPSRWPSRLGSGSPPLAAVEGYKGHRMYSSSRRHS
jgi:hypothetical protein